MYKRVISTILIGLATIIFLSGCHFYDGERVSKEELKELFEKKEFKWEILTIRDGISGGYVEFTVKTKENKIKKDSIKASHINIIINDELENPILTIKGDAPKDGDDIKVIGVSSGFFFNTEIFSVLTDVEATLEISKRDYKLYF